ncbi:MAG: hypothetical protein ACREBG_22735 [Pyrinomonadaceae bacterium]
MSSTNPKDPIIEKIERAREQKKAEADATAGERELMADFQRQANKNGKAEVEKIEALLVARCEDMNRKKAGDIPDFLYDKQSHELRAGNFALILGLTEGFSPYRLDMTSGLRRDANQVFIAGMEPEYEPTNWKLFAGMDDNGFYWNCEGEHWSSEEVVAEGIKALSDNIAR